MQQRFRLRASRDFARLKGEGQTYTLAGVLLGLRPNGLPHNRYGFVTGRHLGKAVARNRVRRLLREAVRLLHPHLKPGYDVVLVARPGVVGKPFSTIQRTVEELCMRARIIEETKGAEA